jgi:hypothetical protein
MKQCYDFLGLERVNRISVSRSNETVVYQQTELYRRLNDIGSQSFISRFFRRILSENDFKKLVILRSKVVKPITRVFPKQKSYPPLPLDQRRWLCSLYVDEVRELRRITGLTFDEWVQDFPLVD